MARERADTASSRSPSTQTRVESAEELDRGISEREERESSGDALQPYPAPVDGKGISISSPKSSAAAPQRPNADSASEPAQQPVSLDDHPTFPPVKRTPTSTSSRPYTSFSTSTKWMIVILGGITAALSPISSNIFVPAIPALAVAFNQTEEAISLGVTVYLIFQAITPSFFGSMSDTYGRRPVYILTLVAYMGANIGLALMPTSAYWLLLVLRMLQATGGSAVISIGAGCVADVAEPRERGTLMSIFQCGAMIGPAFGPLLGGVFASTLGWRAIFWFQTIATGVVLVPLILFMPETLRSLVGDGSIPPPSLNSSPIILLKRRRMAKELKERGMAGEEIHRPPRKPYQPFSAFFILFTPEIVLIFIVVSLLYLEFYCVLTVLSTALKDSYGLSELHIGLCYLPSGCGSICSSLLNGRQVDYYYRQEEKRVGGDYRKKGEVFELEWTRIRCIYPFMAVFIVATIALGWCIQVRAPLPATLVVNFLVGLGTGTVNTATIYGQDLKPGKGGAVSASLNLVRCIFGAIGTAIIQVMYSHIGAGWTFVILSGLCLLGLPLSFLVVRRGRVWRERAEAKGRRKDEVREKEEEKREAEGERLQVADRGSGEKKEEV